jgi:hypothetical protein
MANVRYNSLEGILRIAGAGQEDPDAFATEVLTYHAALEIEMDELLKRLLPRAEKITDQFGGIGFKNKVSVIDAAWIGDPKAGDLLCNALRCFNDLRNAVAHKDQTKGREKNYQRLIAAYRAIEPSEYDRPTPFFIAVQICIFMGDDSVDSVRQAIKKWKEEVRASMERSDAERACETPKS